MLVNSSRPVRLNKSRGKCLRQTSSFALRGISGPLPAYGTAAGVNSRRSPNHRRVISSSWFSRRASV